MVEAEPVKKKTYKCGVKCVMSGDYIILSKSQKGEKIPIERPVYLASISAPRMGSGSRPEEPFAFDAREFIRNKIIGKKVVFYVENSYQNKEFGILECEGVNINEAIVKQGLAQVNERKTSGELSDYMKTMGNAQQEAKNKTLNIWSRDKAFIEKHTRQATYYTDSGFNAVEIVAESKASKEPLDAIVEYVFTANFISVYIIQLQTVAKVALNFLFTPSTDKDVVAEGKAFVEGFILGVNVGIKFDRVEENGTLYARIYHPNGDIAYEIVKNGFSKLNQPKHTDFDADHFRHLKEGETIAKSKKSGIWQFLVEEEKKQEKASADDFTGVVVEIHSGDSLSVQRDDDGDIFRVFLATIKAPAIRTRDKDQPEQLALESKDYLRKISIGKKVKVDMEFSRAPPPRPDSDDVGPSRDFVSVFLLQKNNQNVSCLVLERGLAKTNLSRSGDNASKYLEELLASERKAEVKKCGLHAKTLPPMKRLTDIGNNAKASKEFEAMLMKRQSQKLNGVIEYCLSGMRFKIRLDEEYIIISFNLLGVMTMANDKNQKELMEFSNEALEFAKTHLFQRDVEIEVEQIDKKGTFFGTLSIGGKNFNEQLVKEGLAKVFVFGQRPIPYLEDYERAQDQAKENEVGIWKKGFKLFQGAGSPQKVSGQQNVKVEVLDVSDASRFYLRILTGSNLETIEKSMKTFSADQTDELEKPIRKGTICAAQFAVDKKWYRAKFLKSSGRGNAEVQFIDFGNIAECPQADLRQLPKSLQGFAPEAKPASLAYLKAPFLDKLCGKAAAKWLDKEVLKQKFDAAIEYQQGETLFVVLCYSGKGQDWNETVNAYMLADGLAQIDQRQELPSDVDGWYDFQEDAKAETLGIWEFGGAQSESD